MDFMSIQSAEYANFMRHQGSESQFDFEPVGTGPFILQNYRKDAFILYQANPSYWDGKPQINRLVYDITPDATVRYQKLRTGECHVMGYPNPADIITMQADQKIEVLSALGNNIGYLAFNLLKPPLDDARIRLALSLAVDRQTIIESVYKGQGEVADNPIPPTMNAWRKQTTRLQRRPEQAIKLLQDAGYTNGFSIDLWAIPVQRAYNPNARRMAELIQEDWKQIGVDTQIITFEWGECYHHL